MWSRKVEYFCFCVFYYETKFLQKRRSNIINTKKEWVQNRKKFTLSDKEIIINKRKNGNKNF